MQRIVTVLTALVLAFTASTAAYATGSGTNSDNDEDYRLDGLSTWPGSGPSRTPHHHGDGTPPPTYHDGDRGCPHSLASAVVQPGAANRSGQYDNIARALCVTATGGTVYVHPGVYAESFNVYRSVTIWGIDHTSGALEQPVVEGPPNAGCVNIYADGDVTIRNVGFHGGHGGGCIVAQDGALTLDHVTIAGNGGGTGLTVRNSVTHIVDSEIRDLRDGVLVSYGAEGGTSFSMHNSRVLYNRSGVVVEAQADIDIADTLIFGNADFGLYLQSGNGRLVGNRIFRNATGLFLLERAPSQITGNFFAGNEVGAFAPFSQPGHLLGQNRFDCNGINIRDDRYYDETAEEYPYDPALCDALYEF